jgi:hypothetical protein
VLGEAIKWIIDLLPMTRLHDCHPDMMGSRSIKDLIPTIALERAYDTLEVSGGTQAMKIFSELLNPGLSPARRASLRAALLSYCERDTLAMVKVAQFFKTGDT